MTKKLSPKSPKSNDLPKSNTKGRGGKKASDTEIFNENNELETKDVGGRPSKYKPEYVNLLMDYFDVEAGEQVQAENSKGQMCYLYRPEKLPTLAGFACKIDVHRETLLNWGKAHPKFFDALKKAKDHQERILVENGLLGGYDKTFAIFTAKNLIDWRDKQENTTTHEVGESIQRLNHEQGVSLTDIRKQAEEVETRKTH